MATYSELGAIYNHPSIISTISNEDVIYTSTTTGRPFFYAITAEKGQDNKIKLISSTDEFIFNYGEPNLSLYGQAAYNILNILQNDETVYVIRVLPENAGYSHAFLNIQTKKLGTKKVLAVDNNTLVDVENISLRPVITYSSKNNTSIESLDNALEATSGEKTIDGYTSNLLFYVVPVGRGKYYNKYGFRIYLNTSYDDAYDFRVYNFEVIEYDDYGNASIIEGPFYVSFDPDAMSSSNESMFIENVVNSYSSYLRVGFNENAFDRIGAIINDKVSPSHIDFLTGITREFDGEKENYYNEETQNYEDIHIKLFKYDSDGVVVTENGEAVTNIVDSSDEIEMSILAIDNSTRIDGYNRDSIVLDYMKDGIASIYNNTYVDLIQKIGTPEGVSFTEDSYIMQLRNEAIQKWIDVTDTKEMFDSNETEETFVNCYNQSTLLENKVDILLTECRKLLAYAQLPRTTTSTFNADYYINQAQDLLNNKEVKSIKLLSYKSQLTNFVSDIAEIKTYNDATAEVDAISLILSSFYNILDYYDAIIDEDCNVELFAQICECYNETVELVKEIQDEFTPASYIVSTEENKGLYIEQMYEKVESILESALIIANQLLLDNEWDFGIKLFGYDNVNNLTTFSQATDPSLEWLTVEDKEDHVGDIWFNSTDGNGYVYRLQKDGTYNWVYDENVKEIIEDEETGEIYQATNYIGCILSSLATNLTSVIEYYNQYINTSIKSSMMNNAKSVASSQQSSVEDKEISTYTIQLQDFSNPISLDNGSDGDLALDSDKRSSVTEELLIKAYKGLIDDAITTKKVCPARFIMDANYSANIKNAMHLLATEIRDDIFFYCDLGITANPEAAIANRTNLANFNSTKIALYAQDFVVFDEYTGRDIKVTTPYFLSSKVPYCQKQYGLQYPIAGNKRGTIDGFKSISWIPNESYKEILYNKHINYIDSDIKRTKFGSQLTSETRTTPLSNINNVITVLDIKNAIEEMAEDYQFEFNNSETLSLFQNDLNDYLNNYTANKACESISASVYASDYDKLQKIIRVSCEIKFYDIIERIIISLDVVKN